MDFQLDLPLHVEERVYYSYPIIRMQKFSLIDPSKK